MNYSRMIGNNITIEAQRRGLSLEQVLAPLGYKGEYLSRLTEGRLLLPLEEIQRIANVLGTSVDTLTQPRDDQEYLASVHKMGSCDTLEDQDFILDLFDMYADLREAVDAQDKQ